MKKKTKILVTTILVLVSMGVLYVSCAHEIAESFIKPEDMYSWDDLKNSLDMEIANHTEAIRMDSNNALAYYWRASTYYTRAIINFDKEGDLDKSIADYSQAIHLLSDDKFLSSFAYNDRGKAYFERSKYDMAIADYTEAIRLRPNYALAYSNRGDAYGRKDEYDMAIADYTMVITNYTEAIRMDSNNALAYYRRASTYYTRAIINFDKEGDLDKSIADYSQAIHLWSDDKLWSFFAYENRGNAYFERGDYNSAIVDYNECIKLYPDSSYIEKKLKKAENAAANRYTQE